MNKEIGKKGETSSQFPCKAQRKCDKLRDADLGCQAHFANSTGFFVKDRRNSREVKIFSYEYTEYHLYYFI